MKTNKQPSVEESFQHALDSIVFNHNPIEYDKQFGKLVESVLTDLLQAERQKREEMVEAERERTIEIVKECCNTTEPEWIYKDIMEALTQPNNPK